jgi:[acyl-carrier-protein] S-malonyltransferase
MQDAADAAPGTMAAVLGLDETAVAESCAASTEVWMANDNAPGQIVVAGSHDGVAGAAEAARSRGGKVMALSVGGAFHTPLMASAQGRLDEAISAAPFAAPSGVVVMNVDSAPHEVAAGIGPALSRQLTSPVRWRESLLSLRGLGVTRVVELGPGAVLSGMLKRTDPDLERASIAAPTDLEG